MNYVDLIKNVVNYVDFDVTNMTATPDATSYRTKFPEEEWRYN